MTELKLRDYQREAIDAVFKAWSEGTRRPAIVLPTGAGKTVVFSKLVERFRNASQYDAEQWGGSHASRVIVLAHRDELVDQAIAKLRAVLPRGVSVGKVKATSDERDADVMVCSVQTLIYVGRREPIVREQAKYGLVGLIITDECHHAAAASYKKIYDAFPGALHLGVTATMARGDGVGLGSVWEDVVYRRSVLNLIAKGHLVDVRTQRVDLSALDLGAVKASRGDWQAGDLGRAMMDAQADSAIARAYKEYAGQRQGIVFTPTVETAIAAASALNTAGVKTSVISGETHPYDRRGIYEDFRTGRVQVLANCMVLTEGFDAPWAEVAVIARPTQSAPLYTQMVGRVLRPYPGKTEALVLDLVGASSHKLRTLIDLEPGTVKEVREGETLAEAAIREEEEANRVVPAGSLAFQLKAREVDSFAGSRVAWHRTPAGVMFINCGDTYVFLWAAAAQPGLWDVCKAPRDQKWERTQYTGLSIGEAMAWGEAVSEDFAGFSVAKSARWRREKASDAQVAYADRLGIANADVMTRGQLSEAIDTVIAGQLFDPFV